MDKLLEILSAQEGLTGNVPTEEAQLPTPSITARNAYGNTCFGTIVGAFISQNIYEIELDLLSGARVEASASALESPFALQPGDQVKVVYLTGDGENRGDDDDLDENASVSISILVKYNRYPVSLILHFIAFAGNTNRAFRAVPLEGEWTSHTS